ncbi:MAG TPA: DNA primase, partial [Aggregatilineales bacterium]|nr:DNA primase [Aggregatilineales bacterium]
MSDVDRVKARLDIVDVISSYAPLKKAGRNYKAVCPFHSEKTPSFVVFPDTQTWRCFGQCGEGGDVFGFVMKREGWTFGEALRELAARAGVELESPTAQQSDEDAEAEQRLYTLLNETAEFFHTALAGSPAAEYIARRGLTPQTADDFRLGYAPDSWNAALDHLTTLGFKVDEVIEAGVAIRNDRGKIYDRFRNRFVIPIRDGRGRTIGFGARALRDEDNPKYLNSPQGTLFDKSHILFGFDRARRPIREQETAVIVEGYMDVIQAHQAGFQNVVATIGTALTEHHVQQLGKYADRLVLALDADAAGIKATMRGLDVAREALGDGDAFVIDAQGMMRQAGHLKLDIRVLDLPQGKDPDEFIRAAPEHWQTQVDAALPLAEYIIQTATRDLAPTASVAEREMLAYELLPLLTATEDNLQQRTNIQLLSIRLRLDEKAMLDWANQRIREQPLTSRDGGRGKKGDQRREGIT